MESEVVYYAYAFDVKINGKKQTIYFENEYDAKMGRFIAYCHFDYQRLTIKGFVPPVSQPRKVMLRQKDLENITVFSSYEDMVIDFSVAPDKENDSNGYEPEM